MPSTQPKLRPLTKKKVTGCELDTDASALDDSNLHNAAALVGVCVLPVVQTLKSPDYTPPLRKLLTRHWVLARKRNTSWMMSKSCQTMRMTFLVHTYKCSSD